MILSKTDLVDEAIHIRCNSLFIHVVSKTGLPSRRYSYGGQAICNAHHDGILRLSNNYFKRLYVYFYDNWV